ncbi:thioredoxin family protein [Leucothrix arctica]|uniref:Thioredoxin family protein n=1 Tax=Leucothrix arctica TaxID=1481894 RepID=A0A317CB24_9GAMM|nr:thioredoxin family protein [Leucothrix arctica]PWQ95341.1 thioredoxin family protein [Leucothrix arctica]
MFQQVMKTTLQSLSFAALIAVPAFAFSAAQPGQPAPDFSEVDASGKTQTLADYKGEWLVVEWFNKDCPYVRKHYGSENMQALQKKYTDKGVKWVSVISSAFGRQGHLEADEAIAEAKSNGSALSAAYLLDEDGGMGRAFGAKATPHMFVINPEGVVVYAGAIDDNSSANPAVIAKSTNYVAAALDAGMKGDAIQVASTRAYGCSVKY